MQKRKLLFLPLIALYFLACEKEPDPIVDPDPEPVPDTLDTGKYSYLMYGLAQIDILTDGKAAGRFLTAVQKERFFCGEITGSCLLLFGN